MKIASNISVQAKVLIVLLVSSFILMCLLGFQAIYSISQQKAVANKVLSNYAHLAINEYSRRIMGDVGYRSYFQTMNQWNKILETNSNKKVICEKEANIAGLFFTYDIKKKRVSIQSCLASNEDDFTSNQLKKIDLEKFTDSPYIVIHSEYQKAAKILVVSRMDDRLSGFVVDRQKLINQLIQSFNMSPLLPEVLISDQKSNQILSLTMDDYLGNPLITAKPDNTRIISTHRILQDEYNGIFKGYKISIALNTESAGQLIIGGMPGENLATIQTMIIIIALIFIISLWQLRKERQLNLLREQFVAEVSHELRTPLTQIRMFTEMLLKGRVRNDKEKNDYLSIINRESLRLNHLITNLLKYSEAGGDTKVQLIMQPLAVIVENVVDEFSPIAANKNVNFKMKLVSESIQIDKFSLQRIILNLIDNAVKYGPENQTIDIVLEKKEQLLSLIISDQGPGIPELEQAKIWLPYYRLSREHKAARAGTGIGLFLVKQLVEQIGAKITVENNLGCGCSFTIKWSV